MAPIWSLPLLQVVASGQEGRAPRSFPALLLAQLGGPVLSAYLHGSQQAGHCVRVVAAVLVNLTHQNDAGGRAAPCCRPLPLQRAVAPARAAVRRARLPLLPAAPAAPWPPAPAPCL